MNASLEIEVFRAGDYGPKGTYSPAILSRIADDYDPAVHEAPVTLDHRQEGPAYGWVESLRCAGDVLVARIKDIHESLRDWIRQGAYKKRSVELYRSFARTGRPYLRAVSFLGACPPEVKGLADPVFHDDGGERVVVEFDSAGLDETSGGVPAFVERRVEKSRGPNESPQNETASELESLRGEAARLATELEAERAEHRRSTLERFCEEGRRSGRILPAWETNGLVAFMLSLDEDRPRIETADGRTLAPLEWFQEFLRSLPPQIELGEVAPVFPTNALQKPRLPQPTERASIRPSSLALHEKALAYCEQHEGVTYVEALQAVARI